MKKEFIHNVFIAGTRVPCIWTKGLPIESIGNEAEYYITRIYKFNCEYVTVYDYINWCFTYVCGTPGPMPSFEIEYCEGSSVIKIIFTSPALCFNDIFNLSDSALGPKGDEPCITVENGNIVVSIALEE